MNPLVIIGLRIAAALAVAIFYLWLIYRVYPNKDAKCDNVPPCPLTVGDLLLMGALLMVGFALGSLKLTALAVILVAIFTFHQRGASAAIYWQFQWRDSFSYIKNGFKASCFTIPPVIIIVGVLYQVFLHFGVEVLQPVVEQLLQLKSWKQIVAFIFFAVVVAPLWEEIFFRGVLYPFLKKYMHFGWAMFLSSLAWAAIHWHLPVMLPFTFLGCVLCLLYEKTGKLGNVIVAHAIFNLFNVALLLIEKYAVAQ